MPLKKVAEVVRGLSQNDAAIKTLRNDPSRLAAAFHLSEGARRGLGAADTFFKTEKPIVQVAKPPPKAPQKPRALQANVWPGQSPRTLVASSDTGTLLPGPNTGTFIDSGDTVSATFTAPAPVPSPPKPPVKPPAPQPGPPTVPAAPPPKPPPSPVSPYPGPAPGPRPPPYVPAPPPLPVCPPPQAWPPVPPPGQPPQAWPPVPPLGQPHYPPQSFALPGQAPGACGCNCEAAVAAIAAMVSNTAQAAIVAITALAQRGGS